MFLGAFQGDPSASAPVDKLVSRMERGEFDLIAVGRALISDPEWPKKIRAESTETPQGFSAKDLAELV